MSPGWGHIGYGPTPPTYMTHTIHEKEFHEDANQDTTDKMIREWRGVVTLIVDLKGCPSGNGSTGYG